MEASNGRESNLLELASTENTHMSYITTNTSKAESSGHSCQHQTPVVILINIRTTDANKTSPLNEHNYLKHFRKIYEEKGWITVQCTPTEDRVEGGDAEEIVNTLFQCLQNRGIHKNPIILHVLGHEGIPIHNAICEFVEEQEDVENFYYVKGCILDSCPKQPNGILDIIKEYSPSFHDFLMLLVYLIKVIYPEWFGKDLDESDYDIFCNYSGSWPQLYLYSSVDHIVPQKGVEKAINIRRGDGIPIEVKCWNDTEHARHLFVHEEEYTKLCQQFIEACLTLD